VNGASDDELVARAGKGDSAAFTQLAERHGAFVYALAYRVLSSRADAQDVTQEVFIRMWRDAPQWRPGQARYRTWIYRVAFNLSLNHRQRVQRRHAQLDDLPLEDLVVETTPEQAVEEAQSKTALDQAVRSLPIQQRIALQLRYGGELSVAEVAQIMNISPKAAESLLVRARRELRSRFVSAREENIR
jgi:RNA polymerase sigma-70 factor (ECF subfamily)